MARKDESRNFKDILMQQKYLITAKDSQHEPIHICDIFYGRLIKLVA